MSSTIFISTTFLAHYNAPKYFNELQAPSDGSSKQSMLRFLWLMPLVETAVDDTTMHAILASERTLRMVMEFMEGVSLQDLLDSGGASLPPPPAVVAEIASRLGKPPVSVYYRALMQLGLVVLDGTKSTDHMREDLEVLEFELDAADVAAIDGALS